MAKAKKVNDPQPVKTTKQLVNEFLEQNPIPHTFKFFHKFTTYKYDVALMTIKRPYEDKTRVYSEYSKSKNIDYKLTFSNTESTILSSHVVNESNKKRIDENTNPYPLAIRYIDHDNGIYVIERPPFQTEIDYSFKKNMMRKQIPALKDKKIWIPWTVSVITMGNSVHSYSHRIFVSKGPLNSVKDTVMNPVLPNLFADSRICFGDSNLHLLQRIDRGEVQNNIANIFTYMFNEYFTNWNPDLCYRSSFVFDALKEMGIFDKIRKMKVKKIPKNFDLKHSWLVSHGKFWFYFLYTMSFLDYEETIKFYEKLSSFSSSQTDHYNYILNPIKVSDLIQSEAQGSDNLYHFSSDEFTMPNVIGYGSWDKVLSNLSPNKEIIKTDITVKVKNIPEGFFINQDIVSNPNLIGFIYFEFFKKISEEYQTFCRQNSMSIYATQNQMDNLLNYLKLEESISDYEENASVLKNNFPNFLFNSSLSSNGLTISVDYNDIVSNVSLVPTEEPKEMETV